MRPPSSKRPSGVLSLLHRPSKALAVPAPGGVDADEKMLQAEMQKFEELSASQCAMGEDSRYHEKGIFEQSKFWWENRASMPIHYHQWVGGVGSMKAASANVETVFSGAGRMMTLSKTLGPELLSDYAFCHYNYKYPWLIPSNKEIVSTYCSV